MYLCREIPLYTIFNILNIFFESFQQPRNGQKAFFCIWFFIFLFRISQKNIWNKNKKYPPRKKIIIKSFFLFCDSIIFFHTLFFCWIILFFVFHKNTTHTQQKKTQQRASKQRNKIKYIYEKKLIIFCEMVFFLIWKIEIKKRTRFQKKIYKKNYHFLHAHSRETESIRNKKLLNIEKISY